MDDATGGGRRELRKAQTRAEVRAAALLLATGRVLVLEHRRLLLEGGSEESRQAVRQLTTAALSMAQVGVQDLARQLLDPPAERPR
ncbi:hypothetical protein [Modestobacter sp. I12A-02662]|uniref:hypothetical protein n=1 Tax=Modestobacter sp. I12A-02662 TaxID=1730496 RepID=UPI0034DFED86